MTVLQYSAEVAPLDEATRDRLSALDTTLLSDAMGGRGTLAAAIGPVAPGMKFVGHRVVTRRMRWARCRPTG